MPRARSLAVLFAVVVHGAYAVVDRLTSPLAVHLLHDAARYDAWARAIVGGRVFETGAYSQAPLYPYVVAAIYGLAGARTAAVVALQVLMGAAAVALAGRTAAEAFDEEAGAWAAWLVALFGPLAFFETKLLPAVLTVVLVAGCVEAARAADAGPRAAGWLGAGLAGGLLAIAHPASLLLVMLLAGWIALDRARRGASRAMRLALLVAGVAIVVAPVAVRNHRAGGGSTLIADNGGITFWHGNHPGSAGVYDTPDGFSGAIATQREESIRLAEQAEGRALTGPEVSRHWWRQGIGYLTERPGRAAALVARKALFALSNVEQPLEYSPRLDTNPVRFLLPVSLAPLLALVVAGLPLARTKRGAQPAALAILATAGTLLVFYVSARYRLPAIPALAVVAGGGAASLRGRIARRDRTVLPVAGISIAVLLVSLLWFPLTQRALARTQDAMSLSDLATAQRLSGRLGEAVAGYRRAAALDPSYPFAHLDLAKTLVEQGKRDDAIAELREAIRLAPALAEPQFDLGVALYGAGRREEAVAAFRQAFALDPTSADAGNNLAGTCLELGLAAEARATIRAMRSRGLAVDPPLARAVGE